MTGQDAALLAGLRVLETDHDLALAYAGRWFAGLGADVVVPDGDRAQVFGTDVARFVDRWKRTCGPDDGAPDVVLCTTRRGPRPSGAVRVLVTDHGEHGPRRDWRGGELVVQAATGIADLIGHPDGPPLPMGGHQVDYSTGASVFSAALTALTARDLGTAPDGQEVALSRLEVGAYLEWKGRVYTQVGNTLRRGDSSGPVVVPCRDGWFGLYYRATDWAGVLEALGRPEVLLDERFATPQGRREHAGDLLAALGALTRELGKHDLYARLQAWGVPGGPVETAADLVDSPQYRARDFVDHLEDGTRAPALPVTVDGRRSRPAVPAPAVVGGAP